MALPDATPPRSRTILVADDDPVLGDFIAQALADLGYETVIAVNGLKALDFVVQREHLALALLDVGIPEPGGRELAARIHELTGGAVPCVLMSGSLLPSESGQDGDGVIVAYLPKPFGLEELFATVRRFVPASAA